MSRLLVDTGHLVGVQRLIDDLYGAEPPAGAANALQSQIFRLRRALPERLVEMHPAGYRLAVEPEEVDAHRFTRLAADGHRTLPAGIIRGRPGCCARLSSPGAGPRWPT